MMVAPAVSIHLDEYTGRWQADPADVLSLAVAEAWNAEAAPEPHTAHRAALLHCRRDPEIAQAMGVDLLFWKPNR